MRNRCAISGNDRCFIIDTVTIVSIKSVLSGRYDSYMKSGNIVLPEENVVSDNFNRANNK